MSEVEYSKMEDDAKMDSSTQGMQVYSNQVQLENCTSNTTNKTDNSETETSSKVGVNMKTVELGDITVIEENGVINGKYDKNGINEEKNGGIEEKNGKLGNTSVTIDSEFLEIKTNDIYTKKDISSKDGNKDTAIFVVKLVLCLFCGFVFGFCSLKGQGKICFQQITYN